MEKLDYDKIKSTAVAKRLRYETDLSVIVYEDLQRLYRIALYKILKLDSKA